MMYFCKHSQEVLTMSNDKHRGLIVDSGDSIIDVLWECWVERHHLTAPINVKPQGGGTDYRRDID